jgi:FHS family L-fucose permease-like MFS transporter
MTQTKKNYALPIFMMILLFGMIAFVTNLAAPMGIVMMNQFELGAGAGMLGNMANFIAYAVMGIPGGILLQKIGYKKTALLAIAVGFLGLLIQFSAGHVSGETAFYVYLLGAFVAGFSMTLLNTVVNPMLNTLGGGGNRGNQLIQIGGSFNSVMGTLTPMFVGVLIGEVAKAQISNVFPVMYIAMGVFAVLFFLLWAVSIPEPHAESASEPIGTLMKGALKFRHFVLGAIGIFVYVGVEVGTPGLLLFWLSDLPEYGPVIAGSVAGTYWFLMLIGRLVGASIAKKVSSKAMLTAGSLVATVLVLLAILLPTSNSVTMLLMQRTAEGGLAFGPAQVPINAMLLVLVGLCTSIMWGGIYNLAVEGLGKYVAVASGLFMVMVCGGGILPAVQGWVAESVGYQASYWVMFIGFAYLLYYALIGNKNVNKDIPV